ncbi:MAG: adenylate/guanylate cyclase domain-containing protein [Anaerolineales bacterium]
MADLKTKHFDAPDETISLPKLTGSIIVLNESYIGRYVHEPGWRWSTHVKPIMGTEWCQYHHQGFVLSGQLQVITAEGAQRTIGPGEAFDIPPGHDAWVVGDEPYVTVEFRGVRGWGKAVTGRERILGTLMFTDIVGSTAKAAQMGDRAWKELLAQHYERVRQELDRFRGYEIKTTGDGFQAIFDGAARAVRCAASISGVAKLDGIEVRAGVHTGEVEYHTDTVHGLAMHIAARIAAKAGPGEIMVSSATVALLEGAGLSFEDAGEHELKGIEGRRRLFQLSAEPLEESAPISQPTAF